VREIEINVARIMTSRRPQKPKPRPKTRAKPKLKLGDKSALRPAQFQPTSRDSRVTQSAEYANYFRIVWRAAPLVTHLLSAPFFGAFPPPLPGSLSLRLRISICKAFCIGSAAKANAA